MRELTQSQQWALSWASPARGGSGTQAFCELALEMSRRTHGFDTAPQFSFSPKNYNEKQNVLHSKKKVSKKVNLHSKKVSKKCSYYPTSSACAKICVAPCLVKQSYKLLPLDGSVLLSILPLGPPGQRRTAAVGLRPERGSASAGRMGESRNLQKCHQAPDSRMWPAQKVWLQPCRVLLSIPEGKKTQAHKVSKALASAG